MCKLDHLKVRSLLIKRQMVQLIAHYSASPGRSFFVQSWPKNEDRTEKTKTFLKNHETRQGGQKSVCFVHVWLCGANKPERERDGKRVCR